MARLTLILGLFLGVAPWLLRYSNTNAALWTSVVLGAIVALVALYKIIAPDNAKWGYWIVGLAGFVSVFAPFVLGFATEVATAMWTLGIVGLVIFYLALYELSWRQQKPVTG
jgi:bacteriorhodopsin